MSTQKFKSQNITKKSNLEISDSLSAYLGHFAQQNPYAYEVFFNFLQSIKPTLIIEIGTGYGGFTFFLKQICNDLGLSTRIITYEIHNGFSYNFLKEVKIETKIQNIFGENNNEVDKEVISLIQQEGTCVVLCDGGNKIHEFNTLAKYIKSGDFILAHDYASTLENFKNNIEYKYWNWLEITDEDIKTTVNENKLYPYMQDEFDKAVWVCKLKK
jgi:cephalosporin hydroxylase